MCNILSASILCSASNRLYSALKNRISTSMARTAVTFMNRFGTETIINANALEIVTGLQIGQTFVTVLIVCFAV